MSTKEKRLGNTDLIKLVESKFVKEQKIDSVNENNRLEVGDILRIGYTILKEARELNILRG